MGRREGRKEGGRTRQGGEKQDQRCQLRGRKVKVNTKNRVDFKICGGNKEDVRKKRRHEVQQIKDATMNQPLLEC